MKKLVISLILAAALLVTLSSAAAAADVKIIIDGAQIGSDVAPVIENGTTLVPARAVFSNLGAKVNWDAAAQKMTVSSAANEVAVTINSTTATVNGAAKTLAVPAKLVGARTLVPLRFIAEAIGAEVNYDAAISTITVKYFTNMSGTLKVGGSTTVQPPAEGAAAFLIGKNPGLSITVVGGGSGAGTKGAGTGEFNIGNVSRDLSASEKETYPDLVAYKIGSDGIAVIINKNNPVANLTKQQVFDLFTGKITNWNAVGGSNAPVFVQSREVTSGTLTAFKELALDTVAKGGEIVKTAVEHNSNGLVVQAVAADVNAIGYISFGYLDATVKGVKVENIEASVDNALNGTWPYVRPLNIATKGKASGITAKFIDFFTSPKGIEILEDNNYMALPL